MARQNRVTPAGAIEAVAARGLLMGNRGVLHDEAGRLGSARWRHPHWIACRLAFKGRRRTLMAPRRWTELFFLDEATAFAAGHRPCAECRREDYRRFTAAWADAVGGPVRAATIDRALHAARLKPGTRRQRTWPAPLAAVPPGCLIRLQGESGEAWLKLEDGRLRRWSHEGYGPARAQDPALTVAVLTPEPLAAVFAAGYAPALHPSAAGSGALAG